MHTFELTSPKVSISFRFPMKKKGSLRVVDSLILVSCSPRQIAQKLFDKLEIFGPIV